MPGGDTTTTQESRPWKPAEPYLKEILGEASDIYGQGSSFVDPNQLQTQALEQMTGIANQGSPLASSAPGAVNDIVSSGGMNQQQQDVAGSLMPYATGQYLSGGNPYLDDIISQNTQDITESVKSTSQGLGRGGGNAYNTGELTRGIGEMMNNMRYGDYNQQVQNQMGAANQLFGANAQGQQQALQGASLAPSVNEMRYSDPAKLAQIGGAYRGFEQEQANAPWSDLSKYAGIINPTGGGGSGFGTQTQTQSGGSSPLQAILGGVSLASTLFGNPAGPAMAAGSLWGPGQIIGPY
jgi:hypothetical protein